MYLYFILGCLFTAVMAYFLDMHKRSTVDPFVFDCPLCDLHIRVQNQEWLKKAEDLHINTHKLCGGTDRDVCASENCHIGECLFRVSNPTTKSLIKEKTNELA